MRRKSRGKNRLKEWYNTEVGVGKLTGNPPLLQPIGPDLFIHFPDTNFPSTFTRPNGKSYSLDFTFETNLGSIPGIARWHKLLTRGYYNIAYLYHDAKYTKLVWPDLTFEENNLMCIEIIKTLQDNGYLHSNYGGGAGVANLIYTALKTTGKLYEKIND